MAVRFQCTFVLAYNTIYNSTAVCISKFDICAKCNWDHFAHTMFEHNKQYACDKRWICQNGVLQTRLYFLFEHDKWGEIKGDRALWPSSRNCKWLHFWLLFGFWFLKFDNRHLRVLLKILSCSTGFTAPELWQTPVAQPTTWAMRFSQYAW